MGARVLHSLASCWLAASMACGLAGCSTHAAHPVGADAGPGQDAAGGAPLLSVVTGRLPAPGATGVCADTQLRLSFAGPVTIGAAGKIQVFDAAAPDTPVASVDLAATSFDDMLAGRHFFKNRPVFIDGNDAVVYLQSHALAGGATYFVTVDAGVFVDAAQGALGALTDPAGWQFTTAAAPAPADPTQLVVAGDGTGDFCSVQGAVDFVPAASTTPSTITVQPGTYHEIVFISQKNNLTLRGADRAGTVIAYANNDMLQMGLGTKFRAMVEIESSNNLVIENITLHNTAPQAVSGGSGYQAEALRIDPGDQVIVRDANIMSLQDTVLLTGRIYVANSYIEGNVDFVWGKGAVYFDHCELKTVGRAGYNVQARNPATTYGYVFVDSKLTSGPGISGDVLARIDVTPGSGWPASHVAYINCQMDKHISAKGWLINPAGMPDTSMLRFWEYQSTDLAGAPIDVTGRDPASRQLSDAEAAMMRDKTIVLAGWNPTP